MRTFVIIQSLLLSVFTLSACQSTVSVEPSLKVQEIVKQLGLQKHIEGGYFRQTFKANEESVIETAYGQRVTLTSIYYLLSANSPIGHFHLNRSDIMHYFHTGDPITYYLIFPDGHLETKILGPDISQGQQYQFVVPGGVWKASRLQPSDKFGYGLIGEAVAPGFEYQDMQLAQRQSLIAQFPQHKILIERHSR